MNDKDKFIIKTDDSEEKIFYKLITFSSNVTNKKYLVYCDEDKKIYGSILLDGDFNNIKLEKITEEADLNEINKAIFKVKSEIKGN